MSKPVDVYVGRRVMAARIASGVTQAGLAEILGLSFQQVQKYEKGTNRIGASRLIQICEALSKPVEWFFEGAPGYKGADGSNGIEADFFTRPYARPLAQAYVAISNLERNVVWQVAEALADKGPPNKRGIAGPRA